MGHDPRVGQASDQASEVFRVGAGPLPQRTDPHEGTPAGASQITSHVTEADRHRSLQPASGQPRRSSQPNQPVKLTACRCPSDLHRILETSTLSGRLPRAAPLFPLIEQLNADQDLVEIVAKEGAAFLVSEAHYRSMTETAYQMQCECPGGR